MHDADGVMASHLLEALRGALQPPAADFSLGVCAWHGELSWRANFVCSAWRSELHLFAIWEAFLVFFCSSAVARIHCSCLCSIWPQLSSAGCIPSCKQTCCHVRVLQSCWVPSRHWKLGYGLEIAGHWCLLMRRTSDGCCLQEYDVRVASAPAAAQVLDVLILLFVRSAGTSNCRPCKLFNVYYHSC